MTDVWTHEELARQLKKAGYIVLAPGDTSPLGELVRAAVALAGASLYVPGDIDGRMTQEAWRLLNVTEYIAEDPAVRAWAEKKP